MSVNIGFCGYSYHTQHFHSQYKSGIEMYLFRLQTEGFSDVTINGVKRNLAKGDLLLIKPGDIYEILIDGNDTGSVSGDYHLFCHSDWIEDWWERGERPSFCRIGLDEKLLELWRLLIVEHRRPASEESKELTDYLVRALCLSLDRRIQEITASPSQPYSVIEMMRYIEEHATSAFKVEDVARHVNLSVSRAVHLFKGYLHKTMLEYAHEIRISASIDRMKYTSMTLEQIAEDCGFGSYAYFHKLFKRKYGMAPGIFRRLP